MTRGRNQVQDTGQRAAPGDAALDPVLLDQLLMQHGIGRSFIDFSGNVVETPLANRLHILRCMGLAPDTPAALERALLQGALGSWTAVLPSWVLVTAQQPGSVELRLPASLAPGLLHWQVEYEGGGGSQGHCNQAELPELERHELQGKVYRRLRLDLPPASPGYHRLVLRLPDAEVVDTLLLAAPAATWQPEALQQGKRLWGISAQLYTLRSALNWGMGDFADLHELCGLAALQGADFVLLNPLHCPDLRYPDNASPYSPDDRRFLNPLYIHLPWCDAYGSAPLQTLVGSSDFQARLAAARASQDVDYAAVHRLKLQVLEMLFRVFLQAGEGAAGQPDLLDFVQEGGATLAAFARFQAARWQGRRRADACAALADADFHLWLQWQARRQLQRCQQQALACGMRIGLVQDLAVGSIVDGCEVQTSDGLFCLEARIGAPPDYFNPEGQNWGLPPLLPDALRDTAGRHLRELLRASMSGCGALRIDHVMSLMRLWWCPDDGSNASGAYVYYPVELLFAILRLESQRHRCLVVGEDLGVVPPEIRPWLDDGGIYSNSVFYFEKYDGWNFRKPADYKPRALAMMANHDVPPLACWWAEDDLAIRRRIGLVAEAKYDDELQWRRGEKGQILAWLQEQGLLPPGWTREDAQRPLDADLREALARGFGRVASQLASVQLDDLAGADLPVNIPGTHTEHANWRRKLPLGTAEVFTSTIALRMLRALREERGA